MARAVGGGRSLKGRAVRRTLGGESVFVSKWFADYLQVYVVGDFLFLDLVEFFFEPGYIEVIGVDPVHFLEFLLQSGDHS